MASLLDMTDVPMKNILENCGFKSVLNLRKVCHSLRNFIDDSCFKTDLVKIRITICPTGFSVICQTQQTTGFANDWTSNDLKVILKMVQNSKLSSFSVCTNSDNAEGLYNLEEILKNQTRPLQTECLKIKGSELLKVLPCLDSKPLKRISIKPENYETDNQNLDGLEKMMELEHFKNAVELHINHCFLVRADLRKFFHFQEIRMRLHETSLEELEALKEAFVTSAHMVYFNFVCRNLNGNQLEQLFGTPFYDPCYGEGTQWFFKIQNCQESVLRIYWYSGWLEFRKLQSEEVPQDAVVQH